MTKLKPNEAAERTAAGDELMLSGDLPQDALKPCPFCKGVDLHVADTGSCWACCDTCQAEGPVSPDPATAIARWNNRAPSDLEITKAEIMAIGDTVLMLRKLEKSAPTFSAAHNSGEGLPSSDAAEVGADTLTPDQVAYLHERADETRRRWAEHSGCSEETVHETPTCPFCKRGPFHYVDTGVGMEAVAVICCELGDLYFRGCRKEPETVTISWEDFTEIGNKLAALHAPGARVQVHKMPGHDETIAALNSLTIRKHDKAGSALPHSAGSSPRNRK